MSNELSIPGIPVIGPYLLELRRQIANLLCVTHLRFAGAQPVSFSRQHLELLEQKNFFACEKTDGIRILLYTTYNRIEKKYETFLIDRKNDFYFIPALLPAPTSKSRKPYEAFHVNTILDGELILDKLPTGETKLRYLVFDCLSCLATLLIDKPFHKRLGHFRDYVLKPLKMMAKERPDLCSRIPFTIEGKEMQLSYHIQQIFDEMPRLYHKSDGIIFTSSEDIYTLGTDENILKWKSVEENTVDFKLFVRSLTNEFELQLWYGNDDHRFHSFLHVSDKETEKLLSSSHGRIIECSWSKDFPGNWKFSRFRSDKDTANHIDVYGKIMKSISDSVSLEELLSEAPHVKRQWKEREKLKNASSKPSF